MPIGVSTWYPDQLVNGLDVAAAALIARMTTPPNSGRQDLINTAVKSLKTAGVWDKLDALWITAAADSQAASLNWKGTSFTLSPVNSPTFTANRGYAGDGTTSYLDTNFIPSANGVAYTRDSAVIAIWSQTSGVVAASTFGWFVGGNGTTVGPHTSSMSSAYRINQAATTVISNSDGIGMFAANRTGATTSQFYKNGVSIGSGTDASTALLAESLKLGSITSSSFSTVQASMAAVGAGLNATEQAAFYSAVNAYMMGVGAA